MPISAKKRAALANINIRWSNANKRSYPEPDSFEVPDIDNQDVRDPVSVCSNCAKREQKTYVRAETQTIESYRNYTHCDWLVSLLVYSFY